MIDAKGKYSEVRIGRNVTKRNVPQFVVKGGTWFAARVIDDCSYSLLGCTVSPGFDFSDFTLAKRKDLIRKFPQHEDIIMQLTRK